MNYDKENYDKIYQDYCRLDDDAKKLVKIALGTMIGFTTNPEKKNSKELRNDIKSVVQKFREIIKEEKWSKMRVDCAKINYDDFFKSIKQEDWIYVYLNTNFIDEVYVE
jgi:hypothetical protein